VCNLYDNYTPSPVGKAINGCELARANAHMKKLSSTYTTLATVRVQAAQVLKDQTYVTTAKLYEAGLDGIRSFLQMFTETYALCYPLPQHIADANLVHHWV
jgi:hypothetical protein